MTHHTSGFFYYYYCSFEIDLPFDRHPWMTEQKSAAELAWHARRAKVHNLATQDISIGSGASVLIDWELKG